MSDTYNKGFLSDSLRIKTSVERCISRIIDPGLSFGERSHAISNVLYIVENTIPLEINDQTDIQLAFIEFIRQNWSEPTRIQQALKALTLLPFENIEETVLEMLESLNIKPRKQVREICKNYGEKALPLLFESFLQPKTKAPRTIRENLVDTIYDTLIDIPSGQKAIRPIYRDFFNMVKFAQKDPSLNNQYIDQDFINILFALGTPEAEKACLEAVIQKFDTRRTPFEHNSFIISRGHVNFEEYVASIKSPAIKRNVVKMLIPGLSGIVATKLILKMSERNDRELRELHITAEDEAHLCDIFYDLVRRQEDQNKIIEEIRNLFVEKRNTLIEAQRAMDWKQYKLVGEQLSALQDGKRIVIRQHLDRRESFIECQEAILIVLILNGGLSSVKILCELLKKFSKRYEGFENVDNDNDEVGQKLNVGLGQAVAMIMKRLVLRENDLVDEFTKLGIDVNGTDVIDKYLYEVTKAYYENPNYFAKLYPSLQQRRLVDR